ncbi:MAG: AMP-binding protein [Clostridia bacterium]|nr:AMP-binding protein [Clostridia bacterium]
MKDIYRGTVCYKDFKDMINNVAQQWGSETAFKYNRDGKKYEITFSAFKKDVEALGSYLMNNGYFGKKVALVGENSYEWIVTYFAVANSGNIILPIDKELKANEINVLLSRSETDLLVYSKAKQKTADEIIDMGDYTGKSICFTEFDDICREGRNLIADGFKDYIDYEIDPEALCAIIFTSGTTGDPKGVMLSQKNLIMDAYLSISCMKIPRDTVVILPINHTFGFMASILCQIWMGYCVFINSSLKMVVKDIQEAKPGHISMVPLFLENIYKNIWKNAEKQGKAKALKNAVKVSNALRKVGIDMRKKLFKSVIDGLGGNLEMIISGGAPISDEYMKGFDDFGITVINGFGITECSPIVALNRVDAVKYGTVGNPLPEVQVKIVDPNENGEGEIWVKGDIVMMGYYNNEEATAEVIKDGWFNTGDMGKIIDGNFIVITGRKKNLIILANGKNVYPEELEYLISKIDNVTEVLVYEENEQITAEIYSDAEENREAVRESIKESVKALNETLASYKQIRKIKFRSAEFEKTTTKKIKRNYNKN